MNCNFYFSVDYLLQNFQNLVISIKNRKGKSAFSFSFSINIVHPKLKKKKKKKKKKKRFHSIQDF